MTNYRSTTLGLQYLFGIYEYLMGHCSEEITEPALNAGRAAMRCSESERDYVTLELMAVLLDNNPEVLAEVFRDDPDSMAIMLGKMEPPEEKQPMSEERRIWVIEILFSNLAKAVLLASQPSSESPISQESALAIIRCTKEEALSERVSEKEITELFSPLIQELVDPGDTSEEAVAS